MHFGVVNLNKPTGMTSRAAVDRVKRLVRPAKCGHAGTLDPLANGVLVVCVGPATRLIPYVQEMQKSYRAVFQLGQTSPTDDTEGTVTYLEGAAVPSAEQILAALPRFTGTIEQVPPAYSAVKVAGRRSYSLARQGQAVELAPKLVTIHSVEVIRFAYPELALDVVCGSGTYIRGLGRDLATSLGTRAVMSALVRTKIGPFRVDDGVDPGELTAENLDAHLLPAQVAVAELRQIMLTDDELIEVRHGRPISTASVGALGRQGVCEAAALDSNGQLAAILGTKREGEWWPEMNLMT